MGFSVRRNLIQPLGCRTHCDRRPLSAAIAEGQEAGAVEAESSTLGAGLWRCGIPRDNGPHYKNYFKSDNYLVIDHCTPDEAIRAKEIFESLQVIDIAVHHG